MSESVLQYIESRFSPVKRAGANEVHVACPWCGEDPSKRGRLYINVDDNFDPPGLFHCKLCDERGALNKIRKHFGDPIIKSDTDTKFDGAKEPSWNGDTIFQRIMQDSAEYYHMKLGDNEEAFKYLKYERGLDFETIEGQQLGWADGTLKDHLLQKDYTLGDLIRSGLVNQHGRDFLYSHIVIPYHVSGNAVSLRGKEIGGKYLTPPGHKAHLYNSDCLRDVPDQVIICEGEFDAMLVQQLGLPAVGVPGANTWQDRWTPYIEDVKRVFICFDPDDAGRTGAEKLSTKLGGRAKIVSLPEVTPGNDISDWITHGHGRSDLDMLLIRARGGLLITVDEAYEKWLKVEGDPNLDGLKLGWDMIDKQMAPGLLPAQVMIVLAKTGAGKTIWLLNTFHRIAMNQPDKKILFVSLEQTRNEWFERARRIHRFYDLESTNLDTVDFWREKILMVDKNRITEDELVKCIEQYEYDMGSKPDLVAVDYLGYWAKAYPGDAYASTSAAIMAMKAIAKDMEVPFLAPHQVARTSLPGEKPSLSSARDSGVVEETADFILNLWAEDQRQGRAAEDRSGGTGMGILKSRHGGVGTEMKMQFDPLALTMVPDGDPFHSRAVDGHALARRGDTFDQAIERHRTGMREITEKEGKWVGPTG